VPNIAQEILSSLECPAIFGTELQTPLSDALEADCYPALCQEVFNISKAQTESWVEPDSMADDVQGKSVTTIGWRVGIRSRSLPATTFI
jgi:hypothetical protein